MSVLIVGSVALDDIEQAINAKFSQKLAQKNAEAARITDEQTVL